MATYATNRDSGGLTNEEGHFRFLTSCFYGSVLRGQKVVQNSTPNMSVRIEEGDIRIPYSDYAYMGWSEGYTTITVAAADPSNPRIDRVVAYIDRAMSFSDTDVNNPGLLKYKAVTGTPNAVPSKPNDAAVDSSVSNNPWVELATIEVESAVSTILDSKITDLRVSVKLATDIAADHLSPVGMILDYAGSTAPSGFLLCYGQAISRITYKNLFSTIGIVYGSGDGSTTFNLPDCRGRVAAGKDNMGGSSANRLTDQSNGVDGDVLGDTGGIEKHFHWQTAGSDSGTSYMEVGGSGSGHTRVISTNRVTITSSAGSNTATRGDGTYDEGSVQPTIIFNKIIKY